jgi:Domain of unknown function (DU1801)
MREPPFESAEVAAAFQAYPDAMREKLLRLRHLIFDAALATPGVGALEETLKWGQPSYATVETASGSPIRIDRVKSAPAQYAMYFHCQTNLVATFRELYPGALKFGGNRSVMFDGDEEIPIPILRHCVALALTYHLRKEAGRRQVGRAARLAGQ